MKTMHPVVLLHGWPGSTDDYREVRPLLHSDTVLTPDLFAHEDARADAHAERILDDMPDRAVIVGYDVGSRIAQAIARRSPERVVGLVISPAYPGVGTRPLELGMQQATWYQHFHRNGLAAEVIDGNREAVRAYLAHFWREWSKTGDLGRGEAFDALVERYARPGAFRASVEWYPANQGYAAAAPVTVPTSFLWPTADPLFPLEWSDDLHDWFTDVELTEVDSGHFVPLEAPQTVADAANRLAARP